MSDYHSHRDAHGRTTMDYGSGSSTGWIWGLIILVALVALIAIGSTGGTGDGSEATPTAPVADAPAPQSIDQ